MGKFRIGLISCGNMGMSLADQAATLEDAEVVVCCDVDEEKAKAAAEKLGAECCTSNGALFAREDVDGVIIAAPNFLHREIAIAAAKAGKQIFCEKPMALKKAHCQEMIDTAQSAGVKLMVGQVLRYISPYVWIDELFKSGELGEPFGIQVTRIGGGWGGSTFAAGWRLKDETCGGPLFEINQHEIDLIRCIMGNVTSVAAMMGNFVSQDDFDYEDFAQVLMKFENGGNGGMIAGHSALLGRYDGRVYASKGTLYFGGAANEIEYKVAGKDTVKRPYSEITGYENGVHREVREWVECCLNDTDPPIPGEEGMRNVEIAEAARLSAREGRVVELPL